MSAGLRDTTRRELIYYDGQGHYCEVWGSDEDPADDPYYCMNDPDIDE